MKTKTICLGFIFSALAAPSALCQATFLFWNSWPIGGNTLDAPVFDAGGNRLSGPNFVAVLYGGPTVNSLELAEIRVSLKMDPVPFTYTSNGQSGYFAAPGYVLVDNVPCGGIPWLQVRAWDARLGSSYEEVAALGLGGYGESNLFQKRGGDPCGLPIPPEPLIGLQSFSLRAEVPEPGTWLLLLLGAPLLVFRRWRAMHNVIRK